MNDSGCLFLASVRSFNTANNASKFRTAVKWREFQDLCYWIYILKLECLDSLSIIVKKNQIKNHRVPRVHWDRRARKICGPKSRRCVRTMSPKFTVGGKLRCRPRHLTEAQASKEARIRQPETFIPTYIRENMIC